MSSTPTQRFLYPALISIQILFGLNYIFSKIIMRYVPPLIWGSIRCGMTALVLVLIAFAMRKLEVKKAILNWKAFLIFSLFGIVINQGCFLLGLYRTTPTNSALLNTLIPVFTILIVSMRGIERFTRQKLLGFATAFVGVLVLQKVEHFSFSDETFIGDLLTLANAFSYSLFLSYSQNLFAKRDFTWVTAWLFVFGTPGFFAISSYEWAHFTWNSLPPLVVLAMSLNILLGTVAPYLLISFTLSSGKSSLVALFVYIQPILASLLAYLFLGDAITLRTFLGALIIFTGFFLVLYRKRTQIAPVVPLPLAATAPRVQKK